MKNSYIVCMKTHKFWNKQQFKENKTGILEQDLKYSKYPYYPIRKINF